MLTLWQQYTDNIVDIWTRSEMEKIKLISSTTHFTTWMNYMIRVKDWENLLGQEGRDCLLTIWQQSADNVVDIWTRIRMETGSSFLQVLLFYALGLRTCWDKKGATACWQFDNNVLTTLLAVTMLLMNLDWGTQVEGAQLDFFYFGTVRGGFG